MKLAPNWIHVRPSSVKLAPELDKATIHFRENNTKVEPVAIQFHETGSKLDRWFVPVSCICVETGRIVNRSCIEIGSNSDPFAMRVHDPPPLKFYKCSRNLLKTGPDSDPVS